MKSLLLFLSLFLCPAFAGVVGTAPAPLCNGGAPLAGVYHPTRLIVQQPCALVSGTVMQRRVEGDGDIHLLLALDAPYQAAINSKNSQYEHGDLVVEIIPADQARVYVPQLGAHIVVIGPYAKDNDHGWMELHPARYIIPAATWSGECTPPDSAAAKAGSC